MVSSKSNTTTRAMKRAASTLEEAPGLDVALPDLPYTHYAMMYIDHEGNIKTSVSQSIQKQNTSVFSAELRQNFLEILGERISYHQPIHRTRPRRLKRRNGSDSDDLSDSVEMTTLRVGETERVMDYYECTINRFLQLNCCVIIRAIIKVIQPKKRIKHPYNGGRARDPEKTKPEWWPSCVKHKEPDHIGKEDRIKLFLHILRKLGGYGITAERLREIAGDIKRDLNSPRDIEILYELCRVRKIEEQFERGEVDPNMIVYNMKNHTSSTKEKKENDSAKAVSAAIGAPKYKEQKLALVSAEQGSTLTRTTKDPALASVYDFPGSSLIPMPLNFGVSNRQNNPNYEMGPKYTNSFLQPIPRTPLITDTAVSIQNNYPEYTSDLQHTKAPGHYSPWINPSSYQNVSRPQGYGSLATSPNTTMHSQIPMASTNFHDRDYHNAISQGSKIYHPGSIGHPNGLPLYYSGESRVSLLGPRATEGWNGVEMPLENAYSGNNEAIPRPWRCWE